MSQETVARDFWTNQTSYPDYPFLKERRLYEIQYILKHLGNAKSLLDYGCGDGSALLLIKELTYIEELIGIDISSYFIKIAREKLGPQVKLYTADFNVIKSGFETDITISLGILPYLFEDSIVSQYLSLIKSPKVILRTPCSVEHRLDINTFSKDLRAQYAAVYRSPAITLSLLGEYFTISSIDRAYPDRIESRYGTKHFFFVGDRK